MPWFFFQNDDDDLDEGHEADVVGSDSGNEHTFKHESAHDDEYFYDDVDSTKPNTDSKGWFKLW